MNIYECLVRCTFLPCTPLWEASTVYHIPSWINNLKPHETSSRKYQLKMYNRDFFSTNLFSLKKWILASQGIMSSWFFSKIQEKCHTAHERCPNSPTALQHTYYFEINALVLLVENPFAATEKTECGISALLQEHWQVLLLRTFKMVLPEDLTAGNHINCCFRKKHDEMVDDIYKGSTCETEGKVL